MVTLLFTAMAMSIPTSSSAREPVIIFFTILFTVFYSPVASVISSLYSAEIFPNKRQELGMSWAIFRNVLGAGMVAPFPVPSGLAVWGHQNTPGLFCSLNALAFLLVFFFVPTTNHTATLEDMSYVFVRKLRDRAFFQWTRCLRW